MVLIAASLSLVVVASPQSNGRLIPSSTPRPFVPSRVAGGELLTMVADTHTRIPGGGENFDFFQWPISTNAGGCALVGQGRSSVPSAASGAGDSLTGFGGNFSTIDLVAGTGTAIVATEARSGVKGLYAVGAEAPLLLFSEKEVGVQVDHASDVLIRGQRTVGFVAADVGIYKWSADAPTRVAELVGRNTCPFPDGGPLNYFSDAPSTVEGGFAFFASRTRHMPGGLKAAIFYHNGTGLEIVTESGESSSSPAAFTDPCIGLDDAGAMYVSYVALSQDGDKAWYLHWVGANRSAPVRIIGVGDVVEGCEGERVTDLPNISPACTNGVVGVVAGTNGMCSGMIGARVFAPSRLERFAKPLIDSRATTTSGLHLATVPKTGRGGLARGESSLVTCVYAVLNDANNTFGIYRSEQAL
eukprot:Hpha_TRINITY_DN16849_c3_g1::TRINITY_DN16849_c3_g1_i1::g.153625::m.153625